MLLNKANIAPRLSTAYILSKGEQVAFSFGQFYQTPEHTLMRRTTALDFEKANHYIATYQKNVKGYVFRIEGYYKTYHNLVKTIHEMPNNDGHGYARGIDFFFKDSKTIKNGDYYLSYSYLDTKRDYRNFPTLATPIFAPKHNFNGVYKHWLNALHTMIGATYSFHSGRPYKRGEFTLNMPEFYGGGVAKATPDIKQAAEKFETFKPASPVHPNWGKEHTQMVVKHIEKMALAKG